MDKYLIPKSEREFRDHLIDVSRTLLAILEEKDPYLKKHAQRVANNCANFCEEYDLLDKEETLKIYWAALLHDIGLVGIPLAILQKQEKLSEEERVLIKKHPVIGAKILSNLTVFKDILPMIRHHHEAFDGSGYPDGLKGEEIPLGARIICLFNRYDYAAFPRVQEKGLSTKDAIQKIRSKVGKKFDGQLIRDFVKFIAAKSGKSDDYLKKKETESIRIVFTEILQKFKSGKLNPPVMPQVVREVQNIIKRPNSTAEELAQEIEKDPVISLRLISVANSAMYRGIQEIRTVKHAIPRLGLKETLSIVMAIANRSLYQTENVQYRILMDKLWVHSLACGFASKLLAQNLKLEDADRMFLMGLTHDIGKALLLMAFTQVTKDKPMHIDALEGNLQEAHLSLGGALLKRWGFSEDFIKVVSLHEGAEFSEETAKEVLVVHLANILTRKMGYSLFDGEDIEIAEIESAILLKADPEKLESIVQEVKDVVRDVGHLF